MQRERSPSHQTLRDFVDALQAEGRYTFDRAEAMAVLKVSSPVLKKAMTRLVAKRRIAVPTRGFFVIVPLEYRAAGAPPASWFIDDLMRHLGKPYYVGVLSAAGLHGAAHQQPQEFQVVTAVSRRSAVAGRSRIRFFGKRHVEHTPTAVLKSETGTMRVSTPEATAIDLLRYLSSAGGLGNVATVLAELAERIDPALLAQAAADDGEFACAQRLGYILDAVDSGDRAEELAKLVANADPRRIPLVPGLPTRGCPVDRRWHLILNERVEADL
ncbi:type IV toxin-antitoxin system AbiEi family antitoxin [Candidatus Fermentibacteria bacterium]|nr:type IV toxin-antitoxin system AbiEi family antitoxin [Candidatus Fermentibacteria bacterium]